MATIVYLDPEDEITSAASRIRSASDTRVGLVLPFGSRVATSRINFRLLAREAMANGRRLDIVAPDASARALAASAGLPVFASVGEYEAALDADDDAGTAGRDAAGAAVAGTAAAATTAGTIWAAPDDADTEPVAPAASGTAAQPRRAPRPAPAPITEPASMDYGAPGVPAAAVRPEPRVVHPRRRLRVGRGAVVVLAAILVVGGVAAVAGFLFLPSADITVTPQIGTVGPISLTVTADPDATAVDPGAGVIPATTLEIPVSVQGEFPATGKRVVETKAKGGVRFQNCDPSAPYTIPSGTVVRTRGGIGFATSESVFLPVATISGAPPNLAVRCQSSEVAVTAVEPGTDGNVDAGTIRVVPARYNRNLVRVSNPAATTGGTHEEFKRVAKKDVDAAIVHLTAQAGTEFQAQLENPDQVPEGTTVFPATGVLGELTTDPADPQTLVGQEMDTFTLAMNGTGTVLAVDATPVTAIAEERLQSSISEGSQLVPDSTAIQVGKGSVVDGVITFDVDATAKEVRPLDAAALQQAVLGLSREKAEAALAEYGAVTIALWPDWAHSVPSLSQRVTVTILDPVDPHAGESPSPRPTVEPATASPDAASPSGSPSGDSSGKPVPSG